MKNETIKIERNTNETQITGKLKLDGNGIYQINCEIGFFKHMLESFTKHGFFDLELNIKGDLHVDQHHLVEDTGIVMGQLFRKAIGDGKGIKRSGFYIQQMDDAVILTSIDISGRPYLIYNQKFKRRFSGDFDSDLIKEFLTAFSNEFKVNVYTKTLEKGNDHHTIECLFKCLAKSIRSACENNKNNSLLSTKGILLEEK